MTHLRTLGNEKFTVNGMLLKRSGPSKLVCEYIIRNVDKLLMAVENLEPISTVLEKMPSFLLMQ